MNLTSKTENRDGIWFALADQIEARLLAAQRQVDAPTPSSAREDSLAPAARDTMRTTLLLGPLMAVAVEALQAGTFSVSPAGDDANPGTQARPFATLSRAQAAVRQANGTSPVTVWLRGGTYYLLETLVFTAEDAGTTNAPVIWQAWRDERPVISGGASTC